MTTNPENRNALSRLLGGDATLDMSAKKLMQSSPFNPYSFDGGDGPYSNYFYTDFNRGTAIPLGLTLTEEGSSPAAATYGTLVGGVTLLTSDDVAAKSEALATGLHWQANAQPTTAPLVAEVRWKTGATITASEYFVGLTDATADINIQALSTTSTFTTSTPDDCALMGYSATPTSGAAFTTGGNQHVMTSSIATVNAVVGVGGGAFVAATYYTYTFVMDYTGVCKFYLNGTLLGTSGAVTPTVPLALYVGCIPRTTAAAVITCDYMGIWGARA
jgi:hypothetical protein